jgi:hypothetical protein
VGFTKIEFVVILFVIAICAALLPPAIRSDRGSRRFQCLNNMRNVGVAMQNFASNNGGKLPVMLRDSSEEKHGLRGWPRALMRPLDQPHLVRKLVSGDPLTDAELTFPVFTCPQDEDSDGKPGGLSYIVNGGYGFFPFDAKAGVIFERGKHSLAQDWSGDATIDDSDRSITRATGLFWRESEGIRQMTLDDIGAADGMGNTMMVTESLHAGPWTTDDLRGLAFVVDRNRMTFDREIGPLAISKADLGPFAINKGKDIESPAPTPSSNHEGSVSAVWADGHGTGLSETIDPLVYVRLMTPGGEHYGQAAIEDVEIDN